MKDNDLIVIDNRKTMCSYEDSTNYKGTPELYYSYKSPIYDNFGGITGIIGVSLLLEQGELQTFDRLSAREKQCLYYIAMAAQLMKLLKSLKFHNGPSKSISPL